jgi:hydroxymethylpyrimidine/phosphomethylpyrimidine kinase
MRTALTIAGSDPGGGAGVQADLKTFAAHGVYGLSAVTAITVQDTRTVSRVEPLAPDLVTDQIEVVAGDFPVHAIKIGMVATVDIARAVADAVGRIAAPVVLDPVLLASAGTVLTDGHALEVMRRRLLPLARVVTANVPEAEALTGMMVVDVAGAREAARRLVAMGAGAAIVKGGHLSGAPIDVVDDGGTVTELTGDRLDSRHTHGTGCTFAAVIAARLALGEDLTTAAAIAKQYVANAIAQAPRLGHGCGPLGHVAWTGPTHR